MVNVVFVAPFLMKATLQFVQGAADLSGIRLVLISQDSIQKVPESIKAKLVHFQQVSNALEADPICEAILAVQKKVGPIHRALATLEQLQVPMGEVRDRLKIPGMGAEVAKNFRDKSRMKDCLRKHNIPCARHCLATSGMDAVRFTETVGFPVVVKPPDGAGSRATFQLNSNDELQTYLKTHQPSKQRPVLFEEFIMGNEHTFESVFINGKMVWHSITRYFPNPLVVLKNPWIQWCILLPREVDHHHFNDIRQVASAGTRILGMETGLCHLEWFRRMNGTIAISEAGARPPGGQLTSMTGYAHDFNIHKAWAKLMVFGVFDPPPRAYATGAAFLRGQGKGRVKAIHGFEKIKKELGDMLVESKIPQVGQAPSGTYEGEGYLILRHPVTAVVEKALDRIITSVFVELG